jgi:hypothetical protein
MWLFSGFPARGRKMKRLKRLPKQGGGSERPPSGSTRGTRGERADEVERFGRAILVPV